VVEDNQVASDLLKSGKLKRKYTIIPLKQIVAHNLGDDRISRARALAPGKVEHALCLVGYDRELEAAMKFVFGTTFICEGMWFSDRKDL
jgi:structural maintenance of chromosome 2